MISGSTDYFFFCFCVILWLGLLSVVCFFGLVVGGHCFFFSSVAFWLFIICFAFRLL